MDDWLITWNFTSPPYQPGALMSPSFWLQNKGESLLFMSHLELEFDFGTYDLQPVAGQVAPGRRTFLGTMHFTLPADVVGTKTFLVRYRMHAYSGRSWTDLGSSQADSPYFISVYPSPWYRVFVSRGLGVEDRTVGDPIVEMVKEWGFETETVGIPTPIPDDQVPLAVREEIMLADGVVAIATPRTLDALTGLWRTLEWHHGEVGIGFGIDKPLLILTDNRVALGGLPSYLGESQQTTVLGFDPYSLEDLKSRLGTVMPGFRTWIETKRRQEFVTAIGKLVLGGLAVVGGIAVAGHIGSASAESSKRVGA